MAVYVVAFKNEVVVSDSDAELVADECRAAALAFMEGAGDWYKRELVEWLLGPYRMATRHVRRGDRCPILDEQTSLPASIVRNIVSRAREDVLWSLKEVVRGGSEEFSAYSVEAKHVVAARSSWGRVWVPADLQVRLADRVQALFAADSLIRPGAYEAELFVCGDCDAVTFDGYARSRDVCPVHTRKSGVNLSASAAAATPARKADRAAKR